MNHAQPDNTQPDNTQPGNTQPGNTQPDNMEVAARDIEQFIRRRFQIGDDESGFSRRVNLWEEGYVDSLGVVEVIAFLEQRFRVNLPEEVVFSPDFTTIDDIARFVLSLRAA
jgi:acyl carrier protein